MKLSLNLDEFNRQMTDKGWVVFEAAVGPDLVRRMTADLEAAWDVCREIQVRNGVANDADRTVHHLIGIKPSFLEYLDESEALDPCLEAYFGGRYILNSFGGAINTRGRTSYAQRIHRDMRRLGRQIGWSPGFFMFGGGHHFTQWLNGFRPLMHNFNSSATASARYAARLTAS